MLLRKKSKQSYLLALSVAVTGLPLASSNAAEQRVIEKDSIMYHVTFPVERNNSDQFDLDSLYAKTVILSNLIAGVLYGHLIHETYPLLHYEDDMLYGTLFGQLLQESGLTGDVNTHFVPGDPSQLIHNTAYAGQLLSPGQGGPYQINDYSKRLPATDVPGALGLANYDAVRKVLGYSIPSQDNGSQTSKRGTQALENMYAGPVMAAYFHFNDINRMQVLSENTWYKNGKAWHQCVSKLEAGNALAPMTNIIMNVVYNAGTFSGPLTTYLETCNKGTHSPAYAHVNDFTMDSLDYQKVLGNPRPNEGEATYYRYTRQVAFYLSQLYNDAAALKGTGVVPDNHVAFSVPEIKSVFALIMQKLSYRPSKSSQALQYITKNQTDHAFDRAVQSLHLSGDHALALSDDASGRNDRQILFSLINQALSNTERKNHFKFSNITTKDQAALLQSDIPWYPEKKHIKQGIMLR